MFYVIEKNDQLVKIGKKGSNCFVHFISLNNNLHPHLNDISLIYLRYLNEDKGYLICLKHNESFEIDKEIVLEWLKNNTNKIFVLNKKECLYYFPFAAKLYDLNFIGKEIKQISNKCIEYYYSNIKYRNINCLIPISKHYEYFELLYSQIEKVIDSFDENDTKYQFNNNILTEVFFNIEKRGIKIDKEKYIKHFSISSNPEYNISRGKIFTQYNLYTITGRPANSFNNLNFAALNKSNSEREIFIPQNDWLVEFDYTAYHPTLIGEKIDYIFNPEESVHEHLGKLYFNKEKLSDKEYKKSKEITFQQLYGGIRDEYKNNPYFSKVDQYVNDIWLELNGKGFIETPSKTFYLKDIEKPNPQKILSYLIQNSETYNNVLVLEKIQKYLKYKKTKIILYQYDSILLDFSIEDGKECLQQIQNIMKYPTTIKFGKNYNVLKNI